MTSEALLADAVERLVIALVRQPRLPGDTEPGELSTFQSILLTTLVDEGAMRLGALAAFVGTTDATASRNVDVLEALGLAQRTPDGIDGRGVLVGATQRGSMAVAERRARLVTLVRHLVQRLGPEDGPRLSELLAELHTILVGAGVPPPLPAAAGMPYACGPSRLSLLRHYVRDGRRNDDCDDDDYDRTIHLLPPRRGSCIGYDRIPSHNYHRGSASIGSSPGPPAALG